MDTIQGIIRLLQILIPAGGAVRILLCLSYMAMEEDPRPYRKRIRNVLIFVVLSECTAGILQLIASYFGGVMY